MFNAAVYWEKAGQDYALRCVRRCQALPGLERGRTYFNLANVYRKTCDYEAFADRLERFATANLMSWPPSASARASTARPR